MAWDDKAPTESELKAVEGPSMAESALRGAEQGTTLGFSDEIAGVLPFIHALTTGSKLTEDDRGRLMNAVNAYRMTRDEERKANEAAKEANPLTYGASSIVSGALPATLAAPAIAAAPVTSAAVAGATQGLGESQADLTKGDILPAAEDVAVGGGTAAATAGLLKAFPYLASKLAPAAEKMAERATGATGKFAEKEFAPGTGRELLKRKIVGFGDSPADIARKATEGLETAGGKIDTAIQAMEKKGSIIDKEKLVDAMKSKIRDMEGDPSKAPIISRLKGYISDIQNTPANVESVAGDVEGMTPSLAENVKRGYQSLANYTDPEKTQAVKAAADVFKTEVEKAAENAGPDVAKTFATGKKDWGLLAPVEQAASGRATQLNQSPIGGLLDTATAGVGDLMAKGAEEGFSKNLAKGGAIAAARRAVVPRIASSMAVGTDVAAKALARPIPPVIQNILSRLPQNIRGTDSRREPENAGIPIESMGKFAPILMKAREGGPHKLAVTNYVLAQSNPEYQKLLKQQEEY